jgi:hypothetical protein
VTEVLGDEPGVAELLPQPGRGGVAQGVGSNVLLDSGPRGGTVDDVGKGRLLEPPASEPAEDWIGRVRVTAVAQRP